MLRRVALVRTDVSEELSASFIRVTIIGELGTPLAVASNVDHHHHGEKNRWARNNVSNPDDGGAKFFPKHRFLQEPHGVTSHKTAFFTSVVNRKTYSPIFCRPRSAFQTAILCCYSQRLVDSVAALDLHSEETGCRSLPGDRLSRLNSFAVSSVTPAVPRITPWPLVRERTIPTDRRSA
jgi:hypothetical protein